MKPSNGLFPNEVIFVLAKAEAPSSPDASAKEELQLEIRRLRERIKGLESENTTMHIKLSKTQQDVDQRLTDIEMQIGPEEPPLLVAAGKSANDECPIFAGDRSATTTTTTTTSGSASCSGNSGADEEEDEKNRESFI